MPAIEPVELTTGPLRLRPWQARDVDAALAACQDPDIQRWTKVPVPYLRSDAEQFVTRTAPTAWRSGTGAPFAVVDAATDRLLASVGLVSVEASGVAHIGYWCAAWARGQGVTTRAVTAVARWAFTSLGIGRLEWRAEVGNWASRRVAERCGFLIEGTLRHAEPARDGRLVDCWVGALLPEDLTVGARAAR